MKQLAIIDFLEIEESNKYNEIINAVVKECFNEENIINSNLYINIILTNNEEIRKINKEHRKIDKETDVLSFPMFEKQELENLIKDNQNIVQYVLGDIVISIPKIQEQAIEYNHSLERELSYMIVHGFYHLMGYDHIEEKDKTIMRAKEEKILDNLNIIR